MLNTHLISEIQGAGAPLMGTLRAPCESGCVPGTCPRCGVRPLRRCGDMGNSLNLSARFSSCLIKLLRIIELM